QSEEAPMRATPASPISVSVSTLPPPTVDLDRLEAVERQLALLWEQVQRGDLRQEQRHGESLVLHSSLRKELYSQTEGQGLGTWVASLLEGRLGQLRAELEAGDVRRAQNQELQQQTQTERLAEVESLLALLATRTKEVTQKQHQFQQEREEEKVMPLGGAALLHTVADHGLGGVGLDVRQALLPALLQLQGHFAQDALGQPVDQALGQPAVLLLALARLALAVEQCLELPAHLGGDLGGDLGRDLGGDLRGDLVGDLGGDLRGRDIEACVDKQ
ncbi:hypothetical protein CRUP_014261, partial [Coryphaenoides rupestris]